MFNINIQGKDPKDFEKIIEQANNQMKYNPEAGNDKLKQKIEDELKSL